MPEDAGKKKFIKDFLQNIKGGDGYIEDIWIERIIRLPGAEGDGSTARSLSGRTVNNITQLLEDDLQHSFDEGYFTFRLIAALVGSGKTSLLTYLHELTKTKLTYENFSVVSRFQLSSLRMIGGSQSFSVKLYCYILAQTFWELLNSSSQIIKNKAKNILSDYLEPTEVNQLISVDKFTPFYSRFSNYFARINVPFEDLFFETINIIFTVEPRFTFAYLIDELDSLQDFPNELQETKLLIKALIKKAFQEFGSRIRLLIYLVGTSENIENFLGEDFVIRSLIESSIINLNKGYENEFEMIRAKIDGRIEDEFKRYKNFSQAWQEIKSISLPPSPNLRKFCKEYSGAVLEVYERYFREAPEQRFEGNARELVEAQCRQKWESFLKQKSYRLSSVSTTTILAGHAFDCYIELLHNGICIAKGFGEAKNYELLTSHLETFHKWLEDVNFKPSNNDGNPIDLAFIIAPACPSLLQRKLELKNIHFIQSSKVINPATKPKSPSLPNSKLSLPLDINSAETKSIIKAFKGANITAKKIDKLTEYTRKKPYENLDELVLDLALTDNAKRVLQTKIDENKICFLTK